MKAVRFAWLALPCVAAFVAPASSGRGGEAASIASPRFTMGPQAGIRAVLGPEGAAVGPVAMGVEAGWSWRPTPVGWGCDGAMAAVAPVAPQVTTRAAGRRVAYARDGITEWYVEGARGLEQGFTIPAAPACRRGDRGGSVVIALAGGLAARVVDGGRTAVLRDGAGGEVMRYADLSVVDAAGRALPAALRAGAEGLSIRFEDRGAVYPVTVDPSMWAPQGKLVAADGTGSDNFGWAVAVEGDTAVLGAPDKDQGVGAAYVFARSCGAWSQQQELTPPQGVAGQAFGAAVAIDGDTALVGAQAAESYKGAAYVYTRAGGAWSMQQTLTAGDGVPGDQFGSAVVLQGGTAIVGASGQAGSRGGVYVFSLAGGTWSEAQEIAADGGQAGDQLGSTAALDGDLAVVGAPGAASQKGVAYVLSRSGAAWGEAGKLVAGDGQVGDQLGSAVAIAGGTAIVGAYERASAQGTVYVFDASGGSWSQHQELTAAGGVPGDRFGWTVGIAGDTLLVGAPIRSASMGAAYVYTRSGSSWAPLQTLTAADGMTGDSFGYTAAISGTTAVVGALYSSNKQGAAYVFVEGGADAGAQCVSGSGSGNGGAGGGAMNAGGGGAGGSQEARDLKDHVPFAFGGCGCRAARQGGGGQGEGGLEALAIAVLAAGVVVRRRRRG